MATEPLTPDSTHLERVGYLFGFPIAHSLSPLLHQTIYDHLSPPRKWSQLFLESVDIPNFLRLTKEPKFYGASVTMPHKVAIIPFLDEITQEGKEIGACNTVFLKEKDGKRILVGTNTDTIGIREAFYQNLKPGQSPEIFKGKPGLVIGGGGACRSAVYALERFMGCSPIYIVNRDVAEVDAVLSSGISKNLIHIKTVADAQAAIAPSAIVSCIPDFPPKTPEEIEARAVIEVFLEKPEKGAILEMCYHPSPFTQIAALSEKNGWQLILGTEAMIYQGLEQDRYWTGLEVKDLPGEKVKEVILDALNKARKH
ncbi:shikimate dehydrogenase substrate binding-containing protein [Coleophoma cylindrospora]|uniref:Shikimate dehydrogenase substrate binding-containing protein n=1 Tax=Coleophoma cylindrospora TaxID=1849047 RepID=A0A3D8S1E7_9HELO|nr:shikimate dehydrogenase substrate binding-containing protein [Coleophoma cylindrospora]